MDFKIFAERLVLMICSPDNSSGIDNLPLDLNVHSLRHTNASLLIAQGVDVRTVASLLGHAQASTTLDIYAHAFDNNKRKAQEKL